MKFTVATLEPDREYTDVSAMLGAKLRFQHLAERVGGRTELTARVTLDGPLARIWGGILGADFAESVPVALQRLIALVEAEA